MCRSVYMFMLLSFFSVSLATAMPHDTPLPNMQLEIRAQSLFKQLRCVVCEGQTIADSDAVLAGDMRQLIRSELRDGKSDDDIRGYLTTRYGDHILMSPPWAKTWLLWLAPILLTLLGALLLRPLFRSKQL